MDNKTWLWRKRSSEKTINAAKFPGMSAKGLDEETEKLSRTTEVGAVLPVRNLNEKLASVLLDCRTKGNLATIQEESVEESTAGQATEETEAGCLKKKLDEALRQGAAANERLVHSEAALKQCMQQLSSFREEQERKTQDAVMMVSREFEKAQKVLQDKLMETSKRLANVVVENTNLGKALLVKEKLVEELHKHVSQKAAESDVLVARLDSTEKEYAFLKYEFHMLEKELEVRTEELEYNRQSIDASHRQQLESVQKISKLEAECQRLRSLTKRRSPGPASFARTRSEVAISGWNRTQLSRKLNPAGDLMLRDTVVEKSPEIPLEDMSFFIGQLRVMEEDNKVLKGLLNKKNAELQSSRTMYSRTASRLSLVEAQLIEFLGSRKPMESAKCNQVSSELYPTAVSDFGSDDGVSSSGSWANALITELDHFRDQKLKSTLVHKARRASEMSLMDDFVEVEKLAMVSTQAPYAGGRQPVSAGKELVPAVQGQSGCGREKQEIPCRSAADEEPFDWLQDVLKAISKQQHISKRSLVELIGDIKIALGCMDHHPNLQEDDATVTSRHPMDSGIGGYITWKSPDDMDSSVKETTEQFCQSSLSKPISKIIKLIEGIVTVPSESNVVSFNEPSREESVSPLAVPAEYFVCVLQWRRSELNSVLQQFVHSCNGLLNGKTGLEKFADDLSFTLEWIISSYITSTDTSSSRDKIKRHFGWSEPHSASDAGVAVNYPLVELNDHSLRLSSADSSHHQDMSRIESFLNNLQDENRMLKDELKKVESEKKDVEVGLQSVAVRAEALTMQLKESEQSIGSLKAELQNLKESKAMIEDQMENQKSINEDLDTQLTVAKAKLNEVLQKFSSLEVELEDKIHCCEELEATCLELQLELESVGKKETLNCNTNDDGKQTQNGWEITAASAKLAECQGTILDLGKQLKVLTSPREASFFREGVTVNTSTTTATRRKSFNKRFSLRDQMQAEDNAKAIILRSPNEDTQNSSLNPSNSSNLVLLQAPYAYFGSKNNTGDASLGALAIVPGKKQGFGLLRKLLMRKKKGSSKKSRSLVKV